MGVWEDFIIGEGILFFSLIANALLFSMTISIDNFGLFAGCFSLLTTVYLFENITTNSFEFWFVIFQAIMSGIYLLLGSGFFD